MPCSLGWLKEEYIPKESSNEFFGFYNIFGKFAAVAGPLLLGVTTHITGKTNYGVFTLVILFIVGAVILLRVPNTTEAVSMPAVSKDLDK